MASNILLPKISAPAIRALASIGIKNLNDLTNFTESEINGLHGMGPKALGILKAALAENKLNLKAE